MDLCVAHLCMVCMGSSAVILPLQSRSKALFWFLTVGSASNIVLLDSFLLPVNRGERDRQDIIGDHDDYYHVIACHVLHSTKEGDNDIY